MSVTPAVGANTPILAGCSPCTSDLLHAPAPGPGGLAQGVGGAWVMEPQLPGLGVGTKQVLGRLWEFPRASQVDWRANNREHSYSSPVRQVFLTTSPKRWVPQLPPLLLLRASPVAQSRQDWVTNTFFHFCCCLVAQLCPTLCEQTMDHSPPGSSVCGILQARIPAWVAISFSRGSSWLRDRTHVSSISRRILYHWATREALKSNIKLVQNECIIRIMLVYGWNLRENLENEEKFVGVVGFWVNFSLIFSVSKMAVIPECGIVG